VAPTDVGFALLRKADDVTFVAISRQNMRVGADQSAWRYRLRNKALV
jgi:hypothetical protein